MTIAENPEPTQDSQISLGELNFENPNEVVSGPVGNSDSEDSLSSPFLEGVEEADREIVSKYIKDWDGQVTQKFQSIHEEYAPYKDLGASAEQVQQAMQLYRMAEVDPPGFYRYIGELLTDMDMMDTDTGTGGEEAPATSNLPEYEGIPEEFMTDYQSMKEEIGGLRDFVNGAKAEKESAGQQRQLDELLSGLHTDHGDFDDPAVMGRILQGMDPKDAVKDYQDMVTKVINSRNKRPNPPTLGGGATAIDQVDSSKLTNKKDRVGAVASILKSLED